MRGPVRSMNATDWIINLALVAMVLRQLQTHRLDVKFFLIPAALVAFSARTYLHSIPTAGHDLVLLAVLIGFGAVLGILGGLTTRVRNTGTAERSSVFRV